MFNRKQFIINCLNTIGFVINDAKSLQLQIGHAALHPLHTWSEKSYPVSKSEALAKTIAGMPSDESLAAFQFSFIIPWQEKQQGQTCKIHAFHAATWAQYLANPATTPCPPPVHPHAGMPADSLALTEQAQQLFNSKVGEVYSPSYIMQLAKVNNYQNVQMLHPTTENYIFQLKEVINRGYLALVYFDVGIDHNDISQYGYPDRQGSNLEHSAVVFGYMTTQSGEDFFLTS